MRKHQTVKFVAGIFFVAAGVSLLLAIVQAIVVLTGGPRIGLGAGWGAGFRGWVLLPTLAMGLCAFVPLLVVGALLYFMAQIDQNLAIARTRPRRAARVATVAVSAAAPSEVPAAEETAMPPDVAAPAAEVAVPEAGLAAPVAGAVAAGVAVAALTGEEAPAEGEVPIEAPEAGLVAPAVGVAAVGVAAAVLTGEEAPAEGEVPVEAPEASLVVPAAGVAVETFEPGTPLAEAGLSQIEIGDLEPVAAEVEVPAPGVGLAAPMAGIAAAGVAAAALGEEKPAAVPPEDEADALLAQLALLEARLSDLEGTPTEAAAEASGVEEAARISAETKAAKADEQPAEAPVARPQPVSAGEYSDLLKAAGVNTMPELARQNAANLYERLVAVNAEKGLVRRPPTLAQVADWIEQAKQLPGTATS